MTQSLTPAARQLLAFVRASLWQTPVEARVYPADSSDWERIGRLALQQTVGVLAFEAALSLPEGHQPPKEWRQRAFAFIETNRRTQMLVDRCAAEAGTKLQDEGIGSVLLKGQAYARAYPRPDMRQCGDIDLYVGEDSYQSVFEAVSRIGWEREENFLPKAKHYGCWLSGVKIELHRVAAQLTSRPADKRFQEWSRHQTSSLHRTLEIADRKIAVPTAIFDVVFVFLHLYNHFINGGIGLRHICDWTMLLHVHAKEIDLSDLEQRLKEFGLMRAWKTFAPITVVHLGLPESECPFYSEEYAQRSEKVLATILKEGNFGRAKYVDANRPEGYFAGKLYALRAVTINYMSKVWIDPKMVMWSFVRDILVGSAHTLRGVMKGEWR